MPAEFPHMSPDDLVVWRPFVRSRLNPFTELRYDVRVGNGSFHWPDDQGPPPYDWLHSAQKRIDAVGRMNGSIAVIEVKPIGGMAALGQVLTYVRLYLQKFRPKEPVVPWVVCGRLDNDVADTYDYYRVNVSVFAA